MSYENLKALVNAKVYENTEQGITGEGLNEVLQSIVTSLEKGYLFGGIATPTTNPGTPDQKLFYIASGSGTYSNFGGLAVSDGEVAILKYNGTWTKDVTGAATAEQASRLWQEVSKLGHEVVDAPETKITNLNYKGLEQGSLTWGGAETASDTNVRTVGFIDVNPETAYSIYTSNGETDASQFIFEYDANGTYIKNTAYYQNQERVFTTGAMTHKIRLRSAGTYTPTDFILVVEEGSVRHYNFDADAEAMKLSTGSEERVTALTDMIDDYEIALQGILSTTGAVINAGTGWMTRFYRVTEGDVVKILTGGNLPVNRQIYAFYDSEIPSAESYISGYTITTVVYTFFKNVAVPAGAKLIGITYDLNRVAKISKVSQIAKAPYQKLANTDITDKYYNVWLDAYLHLSYNRAGYYGYVCRFYKVTPGERIRYIYNIQHDTLAFAFFNTFDLGSDGATKVVASSENIGVYTRETGKFDLTMVVPEGACVFAVNCADGVFPAIYSDNPNRANGNTIFDFNPDNEVWPKFAHSKFRSRNNYNNLALIHFSDIHGDEENLKRIAAFHGYYKTFYKEGNYKLTLIDDVIATGDQVASRYEAGNYDFWNNAGAGGFLSAIGNHEAWKEIDGTLANTITEEECYNRYIAPYIASWGVTQPTGAGENGYYPCYYYKDYTASGIRMVVLDCMHYTTDGTSTVTETTPGTQDAWFRAVMADAKTNNLAVLAVSHYMPFTMTLNNEVNFCETGATLASDMLNPLAPAAVQEFISGGGEFIMWIGGHQHRDFWGSNTNYPGQICYLIETANCDYYNEGTVEHLEFTKTQDCFNIISFDTVNKVVKLFRIGNDRDAMLKHKGTLVYNYSTHQIVHQD